MTESRKGKVNAGVIENEETLATGTVGQVGRETTYWSFLNGLLPGVVAGGRIILLGDFASLLVPTGELVFGPSSC